jgi:arabinosaccharide transport system permease protein
VRRLLYSQRLAPYLFILPFVATLALFWIIPVARSVVMSTQEVLYGQTTSVGLDNYARLWNDGVFWTAMFNSARYMVLSLALLIPIPMLLAAVVNSRIGSRGSRRSSRRRCSSRP